MALPPEFNEVMMRTTIRCLAAVALSCALANDVGSYLQISAGRAEYNFDCRWYCCTSARHNSMKIGGG
jgi:hypothetical protein